MNKLFCKISSLSLLFSSFIFLGYTAKMKSDAFTQLLTLLSAASVASATAYSPPYYPSPLGGRLSTDEKWGLAYEKANQIVSEMTIPEKINMTTGVGWTGQVCVGNTGEVPRLDIPSLCLQDSPLGVRLADYVSNFPAGLTAGSTFNKDLITLRGKAIALEHKNKGVHVVLGPAMGPLGRHGAGGRNWEGFGSDPYLQGVAAGLTVKAIQDEGLIATAKHFIGNEQEHFRQGYEYRAWGFKNLTESISANIDDRTLHEIYLWPFAESVHEGVGAIMCSYNQVNNSHACQNSWLINKVLKEELGFQGFVMTDWWAGHGGVASSNAGSDMLMPGESGYNMTGQTIWGPKLATALFNGSIPDWRLNDMAVRIMAAYYYVKLDENTIGGPNFSSWTRNTVGSLNVCAGDRSPIGVVNKHVDVMNNPISKSAALQTAVEAIVLLKNKNSVLPFYSNSNSNNVSISHPRSINLFGLAAGPDPAGPNCADGIGCSNGALGSGWGSGAVSFSYFVTPFEAISKRAREENISVDYAFASYNVSKITEKAPNADVNIIFGLSDSGEGYLEVDKNYGDRNNFTLWHNAEAVIEEAIKHNSNNIIVVTSVGPINMERWIDHENVTAVLFTTPGGQDAGTALAEIIWGTESVSGKLPFTIARNDSDYVPIKKVITEPNGIPQEDFSEGIYVDYRWFDKKNIQPRFEFGYGLSYSNWTIDGGEVSAVMPITDSDLPAPPAWKPISDTCKLSSTSDPNSLLFPKDIDPLPNYIYPYLTNLTGVPAELNTTCSVQTGAPESPPLASGGLGGNPALWENVYEVNATVTNHGPYPGANVFQLYVGFPQDCGFDTPPRQLRGFEKPDLKIGESTQLKFPLTRKDLSVWDTVKQSWIVPKGVYTVDVGFSSRDIKWSGTITI